MRRFLVILGALTVTLAVRPAMAQRSTPAPHKNTVLSLQPLSAMFAVYALELEHAVAPSWTIGTGGTYWSPEFAGQDMRYVSGDVKLRYYPAGQALQGFGVGMSAGYTVIRDRSTNFLGSGTTSEHTASGGTIGANLDYNWLLGQNNGFFIGMGVGAKRIFAKTEDMSDDVKFAYPTARLSLGMAF